MKHKHSKKAYITIITVITISAVSIAVVLSLIFSSLGIISSGQSLKDLAQSQAASNACVEEALERIRQDNNYQTSFSLNETDYSCQVDIYQNSPTELEIQATGISGSSYKKTRVLTSATSPIVTISSWENVKDF